MVVSGDKLNINPPTPQWWRNAKHDDLVMSHGEFYDMFGDGVFGMMSHKIANVYRQLHSPVMAQALMLVMLAVGVANGEYFAIA